MWGNEQKTLLKTKSQRNKITRNKSVLVYRSQKTEGWTEEQNDGREYRWHAALSLRGIKVSRRIQEQDNILWKDGPVLGDLYKFESFFLVKVNSSPPRQSERSRVCASWTSEGEGISSPRSTTTHCVWPPNRISSRFLLQDDNRLRPDTIRYEHDALIRLLCYIITSVIIRIWDFLRVNENNKKPNLLGIDGVQLYLWHRRLLP